MPLSFIKNLRDVTSFAFTRAASQALSEQILAELRHFHGLKRLLMVWDNVCAQNPLLETLSTSANSGGDQRNRVKLRVFFHMFHGSSSRLRSRSEGGFSPHVPARMTWLSFAYIHDSARLPANKYDLS